LLVGDSIIESGLLDICVGVGGERDVEGGMLEISNWDGANALEKRIVITDKLWVVLGSEYMDCTHWDKESNLFLIAC